jgi:protocatechuate 3,4-dioxygenase beta subunit
MMGIPPRRYAKKRALSRCALAALLLVLAPALVGCGGSEPMASSGSEGGARSASCEPTPPDMLGPFYEPNAPVRTSVGSGYVLAGTVLDAGDCEPVGGARIEFWLANPEGEYDDAHRATVPVGAGGEYRFESNVPVSYGGRPPHIHLKVTAPGYRELVTQHYPDAGQKRANFDLVLEPL